jgi:hypothetical protein
MLARLKAFQYRRWCKRGVRKGWLIEVTPRELIMSGYVGSILGEPIYTELDRRALRFYKIKRIAKTIKWYLWNELFLAGWSK